MSIGVVTDQDHRFCVRIVHFEEVLHLVSAILLRSVFPRSLPAATVPVAQ